MEAPSPELLPALAEASRTVGSPQIRNRGTIGGNLGTASPAGDALPPLLVEDAEVELASVRGGSRTLPLREFLVGPKRNALGARRADRGRAGRAAPGARQTFMKVGPRNAMVIAVCSLAVARRPRARRAAGGVRLVRPRRCGSSRAPIDEAESLPELVVAARQPDRRRPRHGRVPPPLPAASSPAAPWSGVSA